MVLDPKKAKALDCGNCDARMQALRNCDGRGTPAKIELNGRLYRRCPRAIMLENMGARHLVNVFMDCRRMNIYPFPGGPLQQTMFTIELFDYLESLISEHQVKVQAQAQKDSASKK